MAQYAGARAGTGRDTMPRVLQQFADRLRKLELYYTFADTPSPTSPAGTVRNDPAESGVVLTGPQGHTWQVGVDEHGRLVAQDGSGARTVLASNNQAGMV